MSYKLNKTNGDLLVDLLDGIVDDDTTNLTLIGRNYSGFGEFLNENFVKLLENFANVDAPSAPIAGQLWFDTTTTKLKVYNGTEWVEAGSPFVQQDQPQMVAGDLWINNSTNQFYFFDGTDLVLVGPSYSAQQGKSGFEVSSILDTQSRQRTIIKLWVANSLVAVISNLTFTPAPGAEITGITGAVQKGINIIEDTTFKFSGIANRAENLLTSSGAVVNADGFLSSIADDTTTGSLKIANSNGLTVGPANNNIMRVAGTSFITENQLLDHDYKIRVRSTAGGGLVDAITVASANQRVGIFNAVPQYNLDVTGDARITGNLLVEGNTTSVDVSIIKVEDINIELGIRNDSTEGNDAAVDGGGIILRSTDGSKDLTWNQSTSSWTSNQNFDIITGKEYKIGGVRILSETELASSVLSATGLTQIGTLVELDVDQINLNDNVITTTGAGLSIVSDGTIQINSEKISGVADPTGNQDVATKIYTDTAVLGAQVAFSLDATGLLDSQIPDAIDDLYPASVRPNGTTARIQVVRYSFTVTGVNITISTDPDASGTLQKSFINVDANGTLNEPVLEDIVPTGKSMTGSIDRTVTRALKEYEIQAGAWTYVQDLVSSV